MLRSLTENPLPILVLVVLVLAVVWVVRSVRRRSRDRREQLARIEAKLDASNGRRTS